MNKMKLLSLLAAFPLTITMAGCAETYDNYFKIEELDITNSDVVRIGSSYGNYCPSVGEARVLVVPIRFTDFPVEETIGKSEEEAIQDIYNVYFGEPEDTTWHSLSSYYEESSYGALKFTGVVTDWFDAYTNWERKTPVSAVDFAKNTTAAAFAQNIRQDFIDGGYKQFADENGNQLYANATEFLKDFDSDGDGSIDVIEMVYLAPIQYTGGDPAVTTDFYWAYCGTTGSTGSVSQPTIGKWAWQSYYTLFEAGYYDEDNVHHNWTAEDIANGVAKVDAHTIIHETGHALSLADYYDTSYSNISPLGAVDMMDNNVGDHNSYSKALLGWVTPYMVDGSAEITISSFTETGDCIFIPYNGYYGDSSINKNTYFNEYLAVEFYTPTGLNEEDGLHAYSGNYPKCPTISGVRILHVDSRLGQYTYSSGTGAMVFNGYTDRIISNSSTSTYTQVATSNTKTETINSGEYLISYLPRGGKTSDAVKFSNEGLFQEGDVFGGNAGYENYTFHTEDQNGKDVSFGYTIEIVSIADTNATIRITPVK